MAKKRKNGAYPLMRSEHVTVVAYFLADYMRIAREGLAADQRLLNADRTMPMLHARVARWKAIVTGINHMASRINQGQFWIEALTPEHRRELGY